MHMLYVLTLLNIIKSVIGYVLLRQLPSVHPDPPTVKPVIYVNLALLNLLPEENHCEHPQQSHPPIAIRL
jgi:hypothetical protein